MRAWQFQFGYNIELGVYKRNEAFSFSFQEALVNLQLSVMKAINMNDGAFSYRWSIQAVSSIWKGSREQVLKL